MTVDRWRFRDLRRVSAFVLTLRLGLVFAVGLVALLGLVYAMINRELIGRSDRILAGETARLLAAPPGALPRRLANDAARGVGFSYAELLSADGERVAGNIRFAGNPRPGKPIEVEGPEGPVRLLVTRTRTGETILVARDISQVRYLRRRLLLILLTSGVVTLAGISAAAAMLARPTLRRVRDFERTADRIAAGAFQARMPLAGRGDELDRFAATVNAMVEAVQHTVAQVKSVTDAVAHDLRTPLTRVRATLDHARLLPGIQPEAAALLDRATTDLDGAIARFAALLRIAELEAGARHAGFCRVDLTDLLTQVRDLYEPLAEERGLVLAVGAGGGEMMGDAGQINLHVRAPVGTRIEETAALFDHIEDCIRAAIPRDQLVSIVDNIGLPVSGTNRAYSNTGGVGPQDGDILVTLAEDHQPTPGYVRTLRRVLPHAFPGSTFSFLPADIISQILNFGAPAPIDLQVSGPDQAANQAYAQALAARMGRIAGIADVRLQQADDYPELAFDVNRVAADRIGITENDVTRSLAVNLAGSFQIASAFWLNPKNGVSYPIVVQTPQYRTDTLSQLENIPVTGSKPGDFQILGALGSLKRQPSAAVVSHYNIQPSFDVYATTQGRDLGAVAADINKVVADMKGSRPKGATVTLRGQVDTMNTAFTGLVLGLAGAILLIYLLIVVNFQSWIDPLVIVSALPAALAGICWMLFATATPLSVPALTGAIMCMGVATANSVLVVSFARERLAEHGNALRAAAEAGATRFRPVLMTALAMMIGMGPMALGLGEGGEQNAPLGRAVIGGLLFATVATLVFVPVVFSIAHRPRRARATQPYGEVVHAE